MMVNILYFAVGIIIGAYVGRFLAYTVYLLPKILLDDDEEREPKDLFRFFFRNPQCLQSIGKRVRILEVGMAILYGATLAFFPLTLSTFFVLLASTIFIAAFITDFEHNILPDQFTITLVWIGLIGSLFPVFVSSKQAIIGALFGYGFFWIVNAIYRYFRGFEGMYPGDFKLNAAIGACFGIEWLVPIIMVSFLLLIIVSVIIHILRSSKSDLSFLHQESPYGCFSSIVTIAVLYFLLFKNIGFSSI